MGLIVFSTWQVLPIEQQIYGCSVSIANVLGILQSCLQRAMAWQNLIEMDGADLCLVDYVLNASSNKPPCECLERECDLLRVFRHWCGILYMSSRCVPFY